MIRNYLHLCAVLLLLFTGLCCETSCTGMNRENAAASDTLVFRHATLLRVTNGNGYRVVEIRNPWLSGRVLHRYVLVPSDKRLPSALPQGTVVRTPLRRSVVFSGVHAGLLDELGQLGRVKGMADVGYVLNPRILNAVKQGVMVDVGQSMQPNVEQIVSEKADAVLVSPFQGSGGYGKLEQTGVPLIECADYMETSPLGRAEWMRFFGMLYGCEAEADSLFALVEKRYETLKQQARQTSSRPRIMSDCMESTGWYVPAGNSTLGQLIKDAGGDYVFASYRGAGSVSLSLETVLQKARNADIWLLKYGRQHDWTYASLSKEREAYAVFRPWRERRIYGCNTLRVPFYEKEPFHPEMLLADLVAIFHPERKSSAVPVFYTPLQ